MSAHDWDDWGIAGEYGNGFELYCPHDDCEWTYTHPFVGAQLKQLREIARKHAEEAHR